jgi:hypothetical protein
MPLSLNQTISAAGYITLAKYLHGTTGNIENSIGYNFGRLKQGFFIARLQRIPELTEFELAGYSITPEHRFNQPKDLDIAKLKKIAREVMANAGCTNLVKVFPNTKHDSSIEPDIQYPFGKGGIPQWKLTASLPMYIFKEVAANYGANVYLNG